MLPQLRKLEEKYPRDVAVVGVHSGKYTAERDTARIRDASIRLGALHPIVNDRQFRVWRSYAVRAWPTLVAVDPEGYVVGVHAGEFTVETLEPFVERTRREAVDGPVQGIDRVEAVPISPAVFGADPPTIAPSVLRYPGKVASDGLRIAISDTGNHRVLVGRLSADGRRARIDHALGGARGYIDGSDPRFDGPQGVCFSGDVLYVADSENHAVRAVDLLSGLTRTLAGDGTQLRTAGDLAAGALSSPWDVAAAAGRLFIAMAGSHQVWSVEFTGEGLRRHCGSRREDLVDGPNPEAALAQPMGLVSDDTRLFFVDAESSAVRWTDLDPSGRVGTIVGTGLFDFGDRDGTGDHVLMQHQQAVGRAEDGRLLVADSYNDALKWVDPGSRSAVTFVRGLHEPSGVALTSQRVYVADTNAHRIAVIDRVNSSVTDLELEI